MTPSVVARFSHACVSSVNSPSSSHSSDVPPFHLSSLSLSLSLSLSERDGGGIEWAHTHTQRERGGGGVEWAHTHTHTHTLHAHTHISAPCMLIHTHTSIATQQHL